VVVTDALLLAAFGSLSLADTLAVLVIEPSAVGVVITMVTVAVPAFANELSAQLPCPFPSSFPVTPTPT